MRILHILPGLAIGGAESMAASLILRLANSHDVAAVSLYPASNSVIEQALARAGIPVWHLDKHGGFDRRMFRALDRVLSRFQPQVVHTHLSVLRYALPSLLRRRIPVCVHTVHTMAEREVEGIGRFVHRVAFRSNVLPVAISREVARSIDRVYGRDPRILIPNGIPVENCCLDSDSRCRWRSQEGFEEDLVLYICVGRLTHPKNPQMLLKAFVSLADPRARLIFAGAGEMGAQLEEMARAAGAESRIHFLGERNDIAQCLAAADVFVLASDWEGNPLSVMEAMASGLPVVATAVGGVPELVGKDGILVRAGDSVQFADAMRRLLENPELRTDLGSAARARALELFGVEHMVGAYESLYQTELAAYARRRRMVWDAIEKSVPETSEKKTVSR